MAEERQTTNAVEPETRSENTAEPEDATEPDAESGAEDGETAPDCVDQEDIDEGHLDELAEGSGCAEVWEHMAQQREEGE